MSAAWIKPLFHSYVKPNRPVRRTDGALMPELRPRAVTINGVQYASMVEACEALGWSYRKVYEAIGESWRVDRR